MHIAYDRWKLPGLEVVHLVDEPLKFSDDVAALLRSHVLINGQGHGLGIFTHVADRILVGLGRGLILVDEHGSEFSGDLLGSPRLMEERHELLPALLLVGDPHRFHIRECKAPFADLRLLFFGQGPQPVFQPIEGRLGPLIQALRCRNLYEVRSFSVVLLQRRFEGAHLPGIDRGEKGSAVGCDPLKEVYPQTIVGSIGPIDIRAHEPPLDSLTDLSKERFILRQGLVPMLVE